MSISHSVFLVMAFFAPSLVCAGQTTVASGQGASASLPITSSFTPTAPSEILQQSLEEVQQTVGGLKLDKWKRGSVREEAANNVDAIQRDLKGTLPNLIKQADAAPSILSKVLPLSRNVDALYDVMVHVVEAARVSAPGDQVSQLQAAMSDLEKARVTLGNQLQQTAAQQEKQLLELRTTVQTQAASLKSASATPAPKCPAPATAVKKKRPAKPAAAPPAGSKNPTPKPK
jgi:hypothetical protein